MCVRFYIFAFISTWSLMDLFFHSIQSWWTNININLVYHVYNLDTVWPFIEDLPSWFQFYFNKKKHTLIWSIFTCTSNLYPKLEYFCSRCECIGSIKKFEQWNDHDYLERTEGHTHFLKEKDFLIYNIYSLHGIIQIIIYVIC